MEQIYINILRRWLWLIVLAAVLAGVTAYLVGKRQPIVYEASTRLIIGPGVDGLSPDLNDLRAGGQLMQTYAELATIRPVLETVVSELNSETDLDSIERSVEVSVDEETQILNISVQGRDPVNTIEIANALAAVLLRMSPSGGESPAAVINQQMADQAAEIEDTILEIERRIELHNIELENAGSADEQRLIIDQIASERARLADAQATLALLYNSLRNTPTNQVKIVELAVRAVPVARRLPLVALVAAMAGMVLALVIGLVFEYFDDSISSIDKLEELTGAPLLGTVTQGRKGRGDSSGNPLELMNRDESPAAEDYRMLGTKLPVSTDSDDISSLAMSSIHTRDDAGEVAGNLGIVLAQLGLRVILVDTNLHKPTLHKIFDISSRIGLSHFLARPLKTPDLAIVDSAPGLSVLTAGAPTTDAFAKLTSPNMDELLHLLEQQSDIVIMVAPPVIDYADSLLISSKSDGVVLIVREGETKEASVLEAIANLKSINAEVIGTVFIDKPEWIRFESRRTSRSSSVWDRAILHSRAAVNWLGNTVLPPIRQIHMSKVLRWITKQPD